MIFLKKLKMKIMDPPNPDEIVLKIGKKSIILVVGFLLAIILAVGILTYVVQPGTFERGFHSDGREYIVYGSFVNLPYSSIRLSPWRWITAPFEVLFMDGFGIIHGLIAFILIAGGALNIVIKSDGMKALMTVLVKKFKRAKYSLIWATTLFFMLFAAFFGIFEEGIMLLPMMLILAKFMGWKKDVGLMICLLALGVGFMMDLTNPFTIGLASEIAGVSVMEGIWFRIIGFLILWVATSCFIVWYAKRKGKGEIAGGGGLASKLGLIHPVHNDTSRTTLFVLTKENKRKSRIFGVFFLSLLIVMIVAGAVPFFSGFLIEIIAGAFLIGAFTAGMLVIKSLKKVGRYFLQGVIAMSPAVFIIMMAQAITYIAHRGQIIDPLIFNLSNGLSDVSPYTAAITVFGIVMLTNFFIPSGSAKVMLLMPLLIAINLPLTYQVIILAFIFGDAFKNVIFPANPPLLIALGIANMPYGTWFKKTILFQLAITTFLIGFLMLAVAIGY